MKVTLVNSTPLVVCSEAIRTAWQSFDKSDNGGKADKALIDRVGNKFKHSSTLEHLVYWFDIRGISRAVLQELARHRMASLTVKSTRYTLKEIKSEESFHLRDGAIRASKYLVRTGNGDVDIANRYQLEKLRRLLLKGGSNDIAKYMIPEAYKTSLRWTVNARSLQNFLSLRSDKSALWEIQQLAKAVYYAIPDDQKYIFDDIIGVTDD